MSLSIRWIGPQGAFFIAGAGREKIRMRYALRLKYLAPDKGAAPGAGGQTTTKPATEGTGKTPGEGADGADDDAGDPDDDAAPNGGNDKPNAAATDTPQVEFTPEQKAEVERLVKARVDREKEAEQRRTERASKKADEDKALEQGEFKTVAEQRQTRIDELERDLQTERRARIAEKYKLPANLALRLVGDTAEELEKDAQELAKLVKPAPAPKTEAGAGAKPSSNAGGTTAGGGNDQPGAAGNGQAKPANGTEQPARRFAFQKPGDVSWGG